MPGLADAADELVARVDRRNQSEGSRFGLVRRSSGCRGAPDEQRLDVGGERRQRRHRANEPVPGIERQLRLGGACWTRIKRGHAAGRSVLEEECEANWDLKRL